MNRECAALAVTCTLKSATPIAHHMQAQKCARNSHRRQYTAEKCKRKRARDEPKYARGQLRGYAGCTLHNLLHLNAFTWDATIDAIRIGCAQGVGAACTYQSSEAGSISQPVHHEPRRLAIRGEGGSLSVIGR